MNILYCNLVICGHLNMIAKSLRQLTIKYNLILDQEGTLSPWLNLICEAVYEYFVNKLDISCLIWIANKWLHNRQ